MKVVHIITINVGGAAIAAKRISTGVSSTHPEVENEFLTLYNVNSSIVSNAYARSPMIRWRDERMRKLHDFIGEPRVKNYPGPFVTGNFGLMKKIPPILAAADIIHIHWIGGFLSLHQFEEISKLGKPVVWTMHDMWCFTGGCYYSGTCERYQNICDDCPCILSGKVDLNQLQDKKRKIFSNPHFYFVGCSQWITDCAKSSYILANQKNLRNIPNCIDIDRFYPADDPQKIMIRKKYGLSVQKKIILFGAMSMGDKRKGVDLIEQVVQELPADKYEIAVFGGGMNHLKMGVHQPVYLGMITEPEKIAEIYAGADVFASLSIQENLANTIIEALACGVPAVAFNIGGMPDMIKHGNNGFLIPAFDLVEFGKAIKECTQRKGMGANARKSVEANFNYQKIGEAYFQMYAEALTK